jgi:hypothetical protein
MVHIGLVTPSFPPMVDGGVAIATGRLVQYLLRYGHQITVLTQRPPAETPTAAEPSWASSSALTIAYRAIDAPLASRLCNAGCRSVTRAVRLTCY